MSNQLYDTTQKTIHSSLLQLLRLFVSVILIGNFKKKKRKKEKKSDLKTKERREKKKKRPTTRNNRVEMPCSFIFIYLLLPSFLFFFLFFCVASPF